MAEINSNLRRSPRLFHKNTCSNVLTPDEAKAMIEDMIPDEDSSRKLIFSLYAFVIQSNYEFGTDYFSAFEKLISSRMEEIKNKLENYKGEYYNTNLYVYVNYYTNLYDFLEMLLENRWDYQCPYETVDMNDDPKDKDYTPFD